MYTYKMVVAAPHESLITPLDGQISKTGNENTATTSIIKDLQAMPEGSKGVIYRSEKSGSYYTPLQGYENTPYYGVRPKDVIMYHAQFVK